MQSIGIAEWTHRHKTQILLWKAQLGRACVGCWVKIGGAACPENGAIAMTNIARLKGAAGRGPTACVPAR